MSTYFEPRDGIQSCVSRKKKSPEVRKPVCVQSGRERRNSAPVKSVATQRMRPVFSRGTRKTARVPTTGRKMSSERSPFMRRPSSSQEEVETDESEHAG